MPIRNILIVEEIPAFAELIETVLADQTYAFAYATSIELALEQLATLPDLLITDVDPESSSGLNLLAAVRARHPKLPVIVINPDTGKLVLAGHPASTHLLAKPSPHDTLSIILRLALAVAPERIRAWQPTSS